MTISGDSGLHLRSIFVQGKVGKEVFSCCPLCYLPHWWRKRLGVLWGGVFAYNRAHWSDNIPKASKHPSENWCDTESRWTQMLDYTGYLCVIYLFFYDLLVSGSSLETTAPAWRHQLPSACPILTNILTVRLSKFVRINFKREKKAHHFPIDFLVLFVAVFYRCRCASFLLFIICSCCTSISLWCTIQLLAVFVEYLWPRHRSVIRPVQKAENSMPISGSSQHAGIWWRF